MKHKPMFIPVNGALTAPLRYLSNYQTALKQIMQWIYEVYPDASVVDVHRTKLTVRIGDKIYRVRLCSDGISMTPSLSQPARDLATETRNVLSMDNTRPYGVGEVIALPAEEIRAILNMRPQEKSEALFVIVRELFPDAVFNGMRGYSIYVQVDGDEYRATVNSNGLYFLKTIRSMSYKLDVLMERPEDIEDLVRKGLAALGGSSGFMGFSYDKPSGGFKTVIFERDGIYYRSRSNDGIFGLQGNWRYGASRIRAEGHELFAKVNFPDEEMDPSEAQKRFRASKRVGKVVR